MKINNILSQKENLKFHKGRAIQITFSDHNSTKLEIYNKNKRAPAVENVEMCECKNFWVNWKYNPKLNLLKRMIMVLQELSYVFQKDTEYLEERNWEETLNKYSQKGS